MTSEKDASTADLADAEKPIDRDSLYAELVDLRRPGLRPDLSGYAWPGLRKVAKAVSPKQADKSKRLRETMRLAAERLGSGDYSEAIADLWGIDTTFNTKSTKRRKAAIDRLETTKDTFNRRVQKEMTETLAAELLGLLEAAIASTAPSAASERAAVAQRIQAVILSKRRAILAGVVLVATLAIGIALSIGGSSDKGSLPPPGSAVNAADGQVVKDVQVRAPAGSGSIEGGNIFRACNASINPSCLFPEYPKPIAVRSGDVIAFKARLHDPYSEEVPYAKLYTLVGNSKGASRLEVYLLIEWPQAHSGDIEEAPSVDPVVIILPKTGSSDLAYIPGSTKLQDRNGKFLAHLPDGIMGKSITLTHIGSPSNCFSCDLTYVRFVTFKARVTH